MRLTLGTSSAAAPKSRKSHPSNFQDSATASFEVPIITLARCNQKKVEQGKTTVLWSVYRATSRVKEPLDDRAEPHHILYHLYAFWLVSFVEF